MNFSFFELANSIKQQAALRGLPEELRRRSASQLGQGLADGVSNHQIRGQIPGHRRLVEEHQPVPLIVSNQPRGGIDVQGGAADHQHIRLRQGADGCLQRPLIQPLLIEHHIRLDDAAAAAPGHALRAEDMLQTVKFPAPLAVVPVDAAMELQHVPAAGGLMEPVDVLGDDGFQLALPLELRQTQMRRVGLCSLDDELIAVEAVELLGALFPEGVTQDRLGRVIVFLMVEAVHTAEVRDAALGGNARPAKEHDAAAFGNDLFQCLYHNKKRPFRRMYICVKIASV